MFVRNPIRIGRTRTQVFTMDTTTLWSDTDLRHGQNRLEPRNTLPTLS